MAEQVEQITIEDLELSLEVYELESEKKLVALHKLFTEKGKLDLSKMFYEERSSLQIKFQNIVGDLTEFLIKQEIASTEKLRRTFYRLLQNPLLMLFKVSRFEIFNLRLKAFDIELEPIEAIAELASALFLGIDEYLLLQGKGTPKYEGQEYCSFEQFVEQAKISWIADQIFTFYSYLRKGGAILRKKFSDKFQIVQIYNTIESKLLKTLLSKKDAPTIKQISILNYEIYELQSSFDVMCFFLKIPLMNIYVESFKELETIAIKAKLSNNYGLFLLIYVRYAKEILHKLVTQGVESSYKYFLQNGLIALLDLWACNLALYKEFMELFEVLFRMHSNPAKVLQIALKHVLKLTPDEGELLRTNFKLELENKHAELLMMLRPLQLAELNVLLSDLYHLSFYTIQFKNESIQQITDLLTAMNGDASISEFFGVIERALKDWNYTVDLHHHQKYIATEWKLPEKQPGKVLESLRLVNNLCVLSQKGFNQEYQALFKANAIGHIITGLAAFLLKGPQLPAQPTIDLLSEYLTQQLLFNIFCFLQRAVPQGATQWESICQLFSSKLGQLGSFSSQVQKRLQTSLRKNMQVFRIKECLNVYINMLQTDSSQDEVLGQLLSVFLSKTDKYNKEIANFRFFGNKMTSYQKITVAEKAFLQKYAMIRDGCFEPKDLGCFQLTELDITTNPVQFQRVMDNYYFTLDSNSKRFLQFLATQWINSQRSQDKQAAASLSLILLRLITDYQISLPVLCSSRVEVKEGVTIRFVQALVQYLSQSICILRLILACNSIRYRNGKDYIVEEVLPMVLKQIIQIINAKKGKAVHYEVLAECLSRCKAIELKADLILKSIEKINEEISKSAEPVTVDKLSHCHSIIMRQFFAKKELDMRREGLAKLSEELIWNEIRNHSAKKIDPAQPMGNVTIPQQIMVTPYALSQDYNIEEYRLDKVVKNETKAAETEEPTVLVSTLKGLQSKKEMAANGRIGKKEAPREIDLKGVPFSLEDYFGIENIIEICNKENIRITGNNCCDYSEYEDLQTEQNITLVQYYYKQLQNPSISIELIYHCVLLMLKKEIGVSQLWTNFSNLQQLFVVLMTLVERVEINTPLPTEKDTVADIIRLVIQDNNGTFKTVLKLLSEIGYTNMWAESSDSIPKNIAQKLRTRLQSAKKTQLAPNTDSFFSILLKKGLMRKQAKNELNELLGNIFSTRPWEQNALMHQVHIDRVLLNLIMQSLQIENLSHVSLMFHSNLDNLRLYTDQLQEGLKALNVASNNRSYNEFILLSKGFEDEQFLASMKLFKENFAFFAKIEKEGYRFKRNEDLKLTLEKMVSLFRNASKETLVTDVTALGTNFVAELERLQLNIANRVKSFYLVTKLRDLSFQNAQTVGLLYETCLEKHFTPQQIIAVINKAEIFSLLVTIFNDLVLFDCDWRDMSRFRTYAKTDKRTISNQVTICSTRRFGHSVNKVYERCGLEFDEIMQRCVNSLRKFLTHETGKLWLQTTVQLYPAFLCKTFIDFEPGNQLSLKIAKTIQSQLPKETIAPLNSDGSITGLVKHLRECKKEIFYQSIVPQVLFEKNKFKLDALLVPLRDQLIKSETLVKNNEKGHLNFNKYKSSEATLQEIELLGYIVGWSLFHNKKVDFPMHAALLAALGYGICDIDDLLDVDFKVWEDLKKVMNSQDSKEFNLNFSYVFESLETFQPTRIELIEKGSSKKVNNMNREEYCDSVCCYLLFTVILKQLNRFLEAVLYVCPKQIISCKRLSDLLGTFYSTNAGYATEIMRKQMRKIGVVLPEAAFRNGKRVDNLKDYQNVRWLTEILFEAGAKKNKLWPDESNLFIVTTIGSKGQIEVQSNGIIFIEHFGSKEQMKVKLNNLM